MKLGAQVSATMTDIGTLGGTKSQANGVSADGSVIVGMSFIAGDAAYRAFSYSDASMTDLGALGGTNSSALAISADGLVIVGWGEALIALNLAPTPD